MLDRAQAVWKSSGELRDHLAGLRTRAVSASGALDNDAQYDCLTEDAALCGLLETTASDEMAVTGTELLDLPTEAIVARDLDGKILFWNSGAESVFGWKRDEVVGKDLHEILKTQSSAPLEEIHSTILLTGRWEGNLVEHTKDGREVTVACRKALKEDRGAGKRIVLETRRDITAQLQAEEGLRSIEKLAAMGRVAGLIAHEINNPLAAITNAFFLLLDHPSLDEEARYYARLAEEGLQRISRITRQTLSLYRESQKAIPLFVAAILDDVLELKLTALRLQNINVDRNYHAKKQILGFPAELKQLFLNLVENAIHAMPEGGRLRVSLRESCEAKTHRRGIHVNVIDTGAGIQPEHAKRLFEPFFTTKSVKSAGLGLWSSKGIVQKYEGAIRFRSLHLHGACATCFSVFIPGLIAANSVETEPKPRAQQWKVQRASA